MRAMAVLLALLLALPATAQQATPSPEMVTLAELWHGAEQREAAAVLRAVTAEHKAADLQRRLADAERRASDPQKPDAR